MVCFRLSRKEKHNLEYIILFFFSIGLFRETYAFANLMNLIDDNESRRLMNITMISSIYSVAEA